jgi:hypothetical protein
VLTGVYEDGLEQVAVSLQLAGDRRDLHEVGPRAGDQENPVLSGHVSVIIAAMGVLSRNAAAPAPE